LFRDVSRFGSQESRRKQGYAGRRESRATRGQECAVTTYRSMVLDVNVRTLVEPLVPVVALLVVTLYRLDDPVSRVQIHREFKTHRMPKRWSGLAVPAQTGRNTRHNQNHTFGAPRQLWYCTEDREGGCAIAPGETEIRAMTGCWKTRYWIDRDASPFEFTVMVATSCPRSSRPRHRQSGRFLNLTVALLCRNSLTVQSR